MGGNNIGLAAEGSTPLGNAEEGVLLESGASNNQVGDAGLAPSIIAAKGQDGVWVEGNGSEGNTISSNSVFDNV